MQRMGKIRLVKKASALDARPRATVNDTVFFQEIRNYRYFGRLYLRLLTEDSVQRDSFCRAVHGLRQGDTFTVNGTVYGLLRFANGPLTKAQPVAIASA